MNSSNLIFRTSQFHYRKVQQSEICQELDCLLVDRSYDDGPILLLTIQPEFFPVRGRKPTSNKSDKSVSGLKSSLKHTRGEHNAIHQDSSGHIEECEFSSPVDVNRSNWETFEKTCVLTPIERSRYCILSQNSFNHPAKRIERKLGWQDTINMYGSRMVSS